MAVSYNRLWKCLIDRGMKKKDLAAAAHISSYTVTRLSKGEPVSMGVLLKICAALGVGMEEIVEIRPEEAGRSVLENRLGLTDSAALALAEERLSKKKALEIFEKNLLAGLPAGRFSTLQTIHRILFEEIYDFAGKLRTVNLAKGNFRFAPVMYLEAALEKIDQMPQATFDEIVEKYVEMNIAHPFHVGNGRAGRIWLDHLLKAELSQVVDWQKVDREDYLLAMERSPVRDTEIKHILRQALSSATENREVFIKGIDRSYAYEGYEAFQTENL